MGLGAGQRVEAALLDAVHQLARLARGGNEVVPAARDEGFRVEREDVRGDGIAVMVVVEEPAVERGVAEGGLDWVEIHTGIGYARLRSNTSPGITQIVLRDLYPSMFVLDSLFCDAHS